MLTVLLDDFPEVTLAKLHDQIEGLLVLDGLE